LVSYLSPLFHKVTSYIITQEKQIARIFLKKSEEKAVFPKCGKSSGHGSFAGTLCGGGREEVLRKIMARAPVRCQRQRCPPYGGYLRRRRRTGARLAVAHKILPALKKAAVRLPNKSFWIFKPFYKKV